MTAKLCPSMMCVPPLELQTYIQLFEKTGIEYLHIDIMDGCFVPNFTLGTDFVKTLRSLTKIPLDIHLMITQPENKLAWFDIQPGELVSVHYESTPHIHRALAAIKSLGAKPVLAINPGTPVCMVEELLLDIEAVLVMAVNPGFAGQVMLPQIPDKIARLRSFLDERGRNDIGIQVDGNVSIENAGQMSRAGANIFVAGTASIFAFGQNPEVMIQRLRKTIA